MLEEEIITAYITEDVLFNGVRKVTGEQFGDDFQIYGECRLIEKGNWHIEKESALSKAEQIRQDKIKSLEKNLAKMKRLTFKIEE